MFEIKLGAAFLILLAGIVGGWFGTRVTQTDSKKNYAALANTFAGGVFLGAAFLHMLPDAIDNFNTFFPAIDYPLFALTASAGFLVILVLDKVIAPMLGNSNNQGDQAAIYPYILMLTLSVHSVITGMALGLENHIISAGAILFAVLAHKSTAAMSLSVGFAGEHVPKRRAKNLMWIFYTTTPIGILTGTLWAASIEGPGEAKFEGIFDALAAGTFFYIAVMDILAEEFKSASARLSRYFMVLAGFSVMAVVAIWT